MKENQFKFFPSQLKTKKSDRSSRQKMRCFGPVASLAMALTLFAFPLFLNGQKLDKNLSTAFHSIQPMDAYNDVKTLSKPEYSGRLTGHPGFTAAAKWAAGKLKEFGLEPLSLKEGYLQAYPSPYTVVDKAEMTLFFKEGKGSAQEEPAWKEVKLEPGKDFMPLLFSDSGEQKAELVFAGWGICAPELGYDDYAGLDVGGKFVLCFRGTPDAADKRYEKYDHHRFRMKTAKDKGALGIIYIMPEAAANPNGDWIKDFLPAMVTEKIADDILKEKGLNSADLRKDLLTYKKPLSFSLESRVSYRVESKHFPDGVGYNIVGYVQGSDPKLRNECLVVGGHFDHCGSHLGLLFPGADDNASGSAVVMEIARAFTKLDKKPKRSVVFVLFGGEEMGLQGSEYFASHLPSQFEKVDTMFNFDMVGEGDGSSCAYSPELAELKKVIEEADAQVKIVRRMSIIRGVGVRSSDFAPFFLKGATCVAFFSNGPHLAYHQPGDTIYRINPDIMADIARLAFLSAFFWANR